MSWLMVEKLWISFFKMNIRTYENIRKLDASQRDDHATVSLLDYKYFKENHKMITRNFKKQQTLYSHSKAIKQISFTWNLDWVWNTTIFFILDEVKKKDYFEFFSRNCKLVVNVISDFSFNMI